MTDTQTKPRSGLTRWLVPIATFIAGAFAATFAMQPPPAAPSIDVPTFGSSAPDALPNSAAAGEVALYRDINDKFVEQLRQYESRLRTIADVAEAEGASTAANDMRDFALETELLVDRYDLIIKQP